jgi:hypothetical protein
MVQPYTTGTDLTVTSHESQGTDGQGYCGGDDRESTLQQSADDAASKLNAQLGRQRGYIMAKSEERLRRQDTYCEKRAQQIKSSNAAVVCAYLDLRTVPIAYVCLIVESIYRTFTLQM